MGDTKEVITVSRKLFVRMMCKFEAEQKQDLYDKSTSEELKELQQLFGECNK